MGFLQSVLDDTGRGLVMSVAAGGALLALETLFPQERPTLASRLRGFAFLTVLVVCTALFANAFRLGWSRLGVEPLFRLTLPVGGWPGYLVTSLVGWVIADFFFYVRHRMQHAFFWRFHAVHHSIESLSAVSSYNHWTEEVFHILAMTLPLSLLLDAPSTVLAWTLFSLHTTYLHSTVRLHFGPMRRAISDNRYHRVHHSKDPAHFNRNFAACFPIWDVLFGTAHFPQDHEWPATGLDGCPEVTTLQEYILRPFEKPRLALPGATAQAPQS